MRVFVRDDVNQAFEHAMIESVIYYPYFWETRDSRAGAVLEHRGPVATVYRYPRQRVLMSALRDANPFFHLFESLWILDGRNDVATLSRFNSNIAQFSDNGSQFHGAYGYRLRYGFQDQIGTVIRMLKRDPTTRRAVLQIWDYSADLGTQSADIPCNTIVFFKINVGGRLDMTVCCRSNDVIWGAYGANAVQFSFLQEYIANSVGVPMGEYTQMSDSFHVYLDNPTYAKLKEMKEQGMFEEDLRESISAPRFNYDKAFIHPLDVPVFNEKDKEVRRAWHADLRKILRAVTDPMELTSGGFKLRSSFITRVALPMLGAWNLWKAGHKLDAVKKAETIVSDDWKFACVNWFTRRLEK